MIRPIFIVVFFVATCFLVIAEIEPEYRILVRNGDPADGVPGATFREFWDPVVNNAEQVLFKGEMEWGGDIGLSNDEGVWLWSTGVCRMLARETGAVPGIPGAEFLRFSNLRLNDGGDASIVATLQGPGIDSLNDTCIVWGTPGNMHLVAREGDLLPGATEGERFDDLAQLDGLKLVTGRPGEIGLVSDWNSPSNTGFNAAVFFGPATNLAMMARDGHEPPGFPGFMFRNLVFEKVRVNPAGLFTFEGETTKFPNGKGVWLGSTNGLDLVLAEGDAFEAIPGATFRSFSAVTVNIQTQLCFVTTLNNVGIFSNTVILAGPVSNLQVVAQQGAHAPGMPADVVFKDLSLVEPVYGERGEVAFRASVDGPGINNSNGTAIWVGKPGALRMICRRGDQALGLPTGVVYHTSFSSTFDLAGLNKNGKVAYISKLEGEGVELENDEAMWAGTPGFENPLIRQGTPINLGGGVVQSVFIMDMIDVSGELQVGGGQDGRARSLNDKNQYVVTAIFTLPSGGGSAVIMMEDVTDPDRNGISRVLEVAHGTEGASAREEASLQFEGMPGGARLTFREAAVTNLNLVLEETESLAAGWQQSSVVVSNAVDQSDLPAHVSRQEGHTPPDGNARFYRVNVHIEPPSQ